MSGSRRRFACFVLGCWLLTSATAVAATPPAISPRLTASCAGDTITGEVAVRVPRRTVLTERLLERKAAQTPWVAIGRSRRLHTAAGAHAYTVRFDVSGYQAYAYRLRLTRPHARVYSTPLLADSCAPGRQVPDAPLAFLLPLSLLATSSLLMLRRRRLS